MVSKALLKSINIPPPVFLLLSKEDVISSTSSKRAVDVVLDGRNPYWFSEIKSKFI